MVHFAAPWEWRSHFAILGLVVSMVGLFVVGVALGFINGQGLAGKLTLGAINGLGGFFLFLRPGVRSWQRWSVRASEVRSRQSEAQSVGSTAFADFGTNRTLGNASPHEACS